MAMLFYMRISLQLTVSNYSTGVINFLSTLMHCCVTLCVFEERSDFYSPQKPRHGNNSMSSENPMTNGTAYNSAPRHDDGQSVRQMDETKRTTTSVLDDMPALCSVQDLQATGRPVDDCNGKQVVKSLLRAMLAKPRPAAYVSSLIELATDSGSEEMSDPHQQPQLGDDDSQSVSDAVAGVMESGEHDSQNNWSTTASPEKASRCPYCLKMFRYRSSYRRHVKIHEGVFSHECTVCLRKFTRKEHFVRHKCDRRPNKPYNVTHDAFRRMTTSQKAVARHVSRETHPLVSASQPFDGPLELTTQTAAVKQLDVPKQLLTGGSVSCVLPTSLDCVLQTAATAAVASFSSECCVTNDSIEMMSAPLHNESRRKSSTPRKVVTVESDSCRLNYSTGRLGNLSSVPVSVID